MWTILTVAAAVGLLIFLFRGPNAVWGGATIGAVVGFVVALVRSAPFTWVTVGKGAVVGILLGVGAELLALIGRRSRTNPA